MTDLCRFGPRRLAMLALMLLASLLGLAAPARADDISAAGRGVVRVVTIASADGEIVGFGHGTGFAVSPTRIVTNAHVVELAARYPQNVVIGVVPSEGSKSYTARLIDYDARRDLALIEITGTRLPALTLFGGPVNDGEPVIALGYPGNVDLATAQSAADYIRPLTPVRSQGGFAGRRALSGTEVLLHTAGIARGNSGGPLLDECGRVIGVNSAITRAEEGDTSFGFAIADTELAAFLRAAGQNFAITAAPCTSIAERLRQDEALAAEAAEANSRARDAAAARAEGQRAQAIEAARLDQAHTRENFIGLAGLLLVLASMAANGALLLLLTQSNRRGAIWAIAGAVVLAAGAVALFLGRPYGAIRIAAPLLPADADAAVPVSYGKLSCRIVPERSRINTSSPGEVVLDWGRDGCADARSQFVENGRRWERIVVPARDQTVSILEYRPAERIYTESRYLLSASAMERARQLQGDPPPRRCSAGEPDRQRLAQQQAAVRGALPPQPDEWLVYQCAAAAP